MALSLIAFASGLMGFVESTAAVPAQSTALAGAALGFLLISALAWLELWVSVGAFRHPTRILRGIGAIFAILGVGVGVLAVGRLIYGSRPEPVSMAIFAFAGFAMNGLNAFLALLTENGPFDLRTVLFQARNDATVSFAVMATAASVYVTGWSAADIAVGAVLAGVSIATGIKILRNPIIAA